ncbi:MAG: transcription termination factor [Gemmatimonadetes bacterium]|nr:transcription termination factor [Gemmatimonadota bacterium]
MNERRRPPRRGRRPRPSDPSQAEGGEPNPYREDNADDGGAEAPPPIASSPTPPVSSDAGPERGIQSPPSNGDRPSGDRGPRPDRGERPDRGDVYGKNGRRHRRGRGRATPRTEGSAPREAQAAPAIAAVTATGEVRGWFDIGRDGGYIRRPDGSYLPEPGDTFVPPQVVRDIGLRKGDEVEATTGRDHRGRTVVVEVRTVNGVLPEELAKRAEFATLPAYYPDRKLGLETGRPAKGGPELIRRAIDLIAPIGFGQRALIVAPARAGKTTLMHAITEGIAINHPEATLLILLVDERPEEVSEAISWGVGEVIASSFDQPAARHVQVIEIVMERARRLVEMNKDVVIVLDSLTRMARAHNTAERGTGRTMSGGLDSSAMSKPKAFFGSARAVNMAPGPGSLTIIATALVETGSRMDDVIFEEFKGTGNCEIKLDRSLAEKRIYPAIDIATSGTRREEKLFRADQIDNVYTLRRGLSQMPPSSGMEWLIKRIAGTVNNDALLSGL